jgi:hypothetical protein
MRLLCILLILFPVFTLAEVNDIFIGRLAEIQKNDESKSTNSSAQAGLCLLVWIEYHWAESRLVYMEDLPSSKRTISYQPFLHNGKELKIGTDLFFKLNDSLYSSTIEMFFLDSLDSYSGMIFNVYACCGIPDYFKQPQKQLPLGNEIIFSTSNDIKIFYRKFDVSSADSSVKVYDGYRFMSFYQETGELNDAFQPMYRSYFKAEYRDSSIIDAGIDEYPYRFVIGDFNGNGRINLYLLYRGWDDTFLDIYEFDGYLKQSKKYAILVYD